MYAAFTRLFNLGLSVSWLVVAVLLLRLCMKRAPKWTHCLLWALVALRLVCPVSIESELSFFNLRPTAATVSTGAVEYVQYNEKTEKPALVWTQPVSSSAAIENDAAQPLATSTTTTKTHTTYLPPLMLIWAAGVGAMLLYALISFLLLRRKIAPSARLRENIFLCDALPSPFILGLLRPRIYLPSTLTQTQQTSVLAHEQAHLARRDHLWKPLGFFLLAVYWFNPLLWLSYILLCRDIELACDERVIKTMSAAEKQAYSRTLLSCSLPRHMVSACPLAFGEIGVKARIRSILRYKKPAFWLIVLALLAVCALAVVFLTTPKQTAAPQPAVDAPTVESDAPRPEQSATVEASPTETNVRDETEKPQQQTEELQQLNDVLQQLQKQQADISLSLLLEGDMYCGQYPGWNVTNAVQCSRALTNGDFAVTTRENAQKTSDAQITLHEASGAWSLTFWQGTNSVCLTMGSEMTAYTFLPQYEGQSIGDTMRTWYDEAELDALGGGYQNQYSIVIEDHGQHWAAAVSEHVDQLYRVNAELVSPGSMFRYSYMSFTYGNAVDATRSMRDRGEIDENTTAFWLEVIFVPENERALDYSMAGNTVAYTGEDPEIPDGAYSYTRCGYVTKAADGYHVSIIGTSW